MSDTTVSVHYERKFSDGNYGSEGLSMSWTVTYEDDDSDLACDQDLVDARLQEIAPKLRDAVLGQLARSYAEGVRWAAKRELTPPEPVTAPAGVDGMPASLEEVPF